jgi:hypothetical protein
MDWLGSFKKISKWQRANKVYNIRGNHFSLYIERINKNEEGMYLKDEKQWKLLKLTQRIKTC